MMQGRCTSETPWFNLARQEIQPLFQDLVVVQASVKSSECPGKSCLKVEIIWLEARVESGAAYNGSQSLNITGALSHLHLAGRIVKNSYTVYSPKAEGVGFPNFQSLRGNCPL